MSGLPWVFHDHGGWRADVDGGHYLIQAKHVIRHGQVMEKRFEANLIRSRKPAVPLGFHPDVTAAGLACTRDYMDRRSRWVEDMEAGAIG